MDSLLTIVLVSVAGMAVGALWYSQVLFGPMWQRLMGISFEDIKNSGQAKPMAITFLATIIMAYVLSYVVSWLYVDTFTRGVEVGAWMWLGFTATSQLINGVYEKRPFGLYAINTLHHLVVLGLMGGLLAMF